MNNSYGHSNMQYQPPQPVPEEKKRFSKWWSFSFFILSMVLVIVGGGLLGAWASSHTIYTTTTGGYHYYYSDSNDGLFHGALACFVIAGLAKIVAWILLVVWLVKRSRARGDDVVTYVQQPTYHYAPPMLPQPQPAYGGAPVKA